ncbi:phosphatase PAP2 family protein, partial [Klebsiella aerogenes]|uniref:phosphatase PAP2 family protein n=1 Tax=Klebsiella aerogenes TaxID=548 RepID=UPI0013D1E30A
SQQSSIALAMGSGHNVKSWRYQAFAVITTAAILFTFLYLGIHWLSDLVGGTLLAIVCCLLE